MSNSDAKEQITCPYCGTTCSYSDFHHAYDGSVSCQNCGKTLTADDHMVSIVGESIHKVEHPDDALLAIMAVCLLLFASWIVAIPVVLCVCLVRVSNSSSPRKRMKEGLGID